MLVRAALGSLASLLVEGSCPVYSGCLFGLVWISEEGYVSFVESHQYSTSPGGNSGVNLSLNC